MVAPSIRANASASAAVSLAPLPRVCRRPSTCSCRRWAAPVFPDVITIARKRVFGVRLPSGEAAMTGQERPCPVVTPFHRQGIISWAFGARLAAPSLAAAVTIVPTAPHRGAQTPVVQQLVWQL